MNQPYLFNIQKFSVHDGPGIRTTLFFKGCPMRCRWCHNPESQKSCQEEMIGKEGKTEIIGKKYTVNELLHLVSKDQIFFDQSGGGVTLSGGEVMVQDMDYILNLLKGFRRQGISVAIDTCGIAPTENFERVAPYTDLFLYDLKMMDSLLHQKYTKTPLDSVLENLKYLGRRKAAIDLRLIMIPELNMSPGMVGRIVEWLEKERVAVKQISLLPYHDFGRDKYRKLNRTCTQNFNKPSDEEIGRVRDFFEHRGYCVSVGG